jgi:hypothetical protein
MIAIDIPNSSSMALIILDLFYINLVPFAVMIDL